MTQKEIYDYIEALVDDAVEEAQRYGMSDDIEEYVSRTIDESIDSSEYTIYYHKAHQLCQTIDTSAGQAWLEDLDFKTSSYDEFASQLAYATLREEAYALLPEHKLYNELLELEQAAETLDLA